MTDNLLQQFDVEEWNSTLASTVKGGDQISGLSNDTVSTEAEFAVATESAIATANRRTAESLAHAFRHFYPSLPYTLTTGLEKHLIRICDVLACDNDESNTTTSSEALTNFFAFLKQRKIKSSPSISLRLDGGVSAVWPNRECGPVTFDFLPNGEAIYYYVRETPERLVYEENRLSAEKLRTAKLPSFIGL